MQPYELIVENVAESMYNLLQSTKTNYYLFSVAIVLSMQYLRKCPYLRG